MKKTILFSGILLLSSLASAATVEFHIANGTNTGSWNTAQTPITAKVGDVIRFYNDDSIVHQLHTNGAPCGHGPRMQPNTTWDCVASQPFSANKSGPLYEHNVGPTAAVYLEVSN
jgi:hypothetical protein